MTVNMICIGCPMGCPLAVTVADGRAVSVTGNSCGVGKKYAESEIAAPVRMVTSTAPSEVGAPVPVKTRTAVPKARVFDVVAAIKAAVVRPPVAIGDVVISNVAGTGVDVVATRDVSN